MSNIGQNCFCVVGVGSSVRSSVIWCQTSIFYSSDNTVIILLLSGQFLYIFV